MLHNVCPNPEDFYSKIFENIPNAISITTLPEGRYVAVNKAWLRATGYEPNEVIGHTVMQMNIWEGKDQRSHLIERIKKHGSMRGIRGNFQMKNGEIRSTVSSVDIITINNEPHLLWVIHQIVDPEQLQDQLQQEKRFNSAILMHSSNLIVVCDPHGRIIRVNDACTSITGYSENEIVGRHFWEMNASPTDIDHAKTLFKGTGHDASLGDQWVNQWKTRNGESRIISWTSTFLYDEQIAKSYIINIGTDITAHRIIEDRLRDKEAELRCIFENANGIIFTLSAAGILLFISPGWTELLGHEICEVQGKSFQDFVHPDYIPICHNAIEEIVANGKPFKDLEYKVRHQNGTWRWHRCSGGVARDENNEVLFYIGIAVDVTDRKLMDDALSLSEYKFSKAFDTSPTPFSISTLQEGRFIDVNDGFCRVVGYTKEEILGKTVFELGLWGSLSDRSHVAEKLMQRQSVRNMDIYFRKKSGQLRMGSYSADRIDMTEEACILSVLTDVTDQKQAEAEIKYLSFHDKLTGLYNRAYFEEELIRMDTARQLPISIIMGDVNGLKVMNDALGHHEGDRLLQAVAAALKESCREEDVVARWGGDEFIILLPHCDYNAAVRVMERIKKCDLNIGTLPVKTSIALGTASKTQPDQALLQVIKDAEDKMYRNKLLEDRSTRSSFLISLEKTLWTRNHETEEHCHRMQEMANQIGEFIGLPESELDNLKLLAALHDIGKIAIPNSILDKQGKLTAEEWETIHKHPEIGYRIALSSPEMAPIAEAILHHHECWDGSGYPLGLKHEEIPLLSRIIAIVDSFDVMVHGRPYQNAISNHEAWCEIQCCAGSIFDPQLVKDIAPIIIP